MAPEKTSDRGPRPKQTYVELIKTAITNQGGEGAALQDIYEAIQTAHPYFSPEGKGWKNSVRHTLSLNPAFQNMPRTDPQPGKGGLWKIDHTAPEIFTRKRNPKPSQRAKQAAATAAATAAAAGTTGEVGLAEASSSSGRRPAKRARTGLLPPPPPSSSASSFKQEVGELSASSALDTDGLGVGHFRGDDDGGGPSRSESPLRPSLSSIYNLQPFGQFQPHPMYQPQQQQQQQLQLLPYLGPGQDLPAFLPNLWNSQPAFDPSLAHAGGSGSGLLQHDATSGLPPYAFPPAPPPPPPQQAPYPYPMHVGHPLTNHLYSVHPPAGGPTYPGNGYSFSPLPPAARTSNDP